MGSTERRLRLTAVGDFVQLNPPFRGGVVPAGAAAIRFVSVLQVVRRRHLVGEEREDDGRDAAGDDVQHDEQERVPRHPAKEERHSTEEEARPGEADLGSARNPLRVDECNLHVISFTVELVIFSTPQLPRLSTQRRSS